MAIEQVNGVRVNYNQRDLFTGVGKPVTFGQVNQLSAEFTYDSLPAAGAVGDAVIAELPAGAVVKSAYFIVTTAFAGGTSLAVQSAKASDGTALLANAFVTATQGALANIDADGDVLVGTGAGINASVSEAA